jgi:hypothetical protein
MLAMLATVSTLELVNAGELLTMTLLNFLPKFRSGIVLSGFSTYLRGPLPWTEYRGWGATVQDRRGAALIVLHVARSAL